MIKWVEALLIAGGLAALLLPFIGFYVAWIQIRRQKEYKQCRETMDSEKDESDYTRYIMGSNQILMYLFLALYSIAYTKSRRTKRQIRFVGVTIPILLIITIIMGVINWGLYAASHCKDKTYGTAAIISTNVLFILTLITVAGSLAIFFMMSNRGASAGKVSH